MDLKEFITETITGIVEATSELQQKYEGKGVIINPPLSLQNPNLYEEGGSSHIYRSVETVEFDVAVSVEKGTDVDAKASMRIFAAEAGAGGKRNTRNETVNRIKFSVPIALHPSNAEQANREARKQETPPFTKRKVI